MAGYSGRSLANHGLVFRIEAAFGQKRSCVHCRTRRIRVRGKNGEWVAL